MHILRWLYGWRMWTRALWMVRRKRHGAGKMPWRYALAMARDVRFLVDGQRRPRVIRRRLQSFR